MAEKLSKGTLGNLQSVASANVTVNSVVQQLANTALAVDDPKTRSLIMKAASDLLKASQDITGALEQVAGGH